MVVTEIYNIFLFNPLINVLIALYHLLFGNLGLAIIVMTVILKVLMYPLTKPSLEAAKKQRELQPQLAKLKKKYKNKQTLSQKQMALYKQHGINPAAGCFPQLIQLVVIFALYRVFMNLLSTNGVVGEELNSILYTDGLKFQVGSVLNTHFALWDLAKPDPTYILPIIAAASQFVMSKFMMSKNTASMQKTVKNTPDKSDDVMYNMQEQMVYIMPIVTLVFGVKLPSGLVLYWFVSTLIALVQYIVLNRDTLKNFSLAGYKPDIILKQLRDGKRRT